MQGALEIPVKLTVRMEAASENNQAVERFKEQVRRHYKEPTNGKFDGWTKEVLSDKFEEESSDEEIDVSNPLTGYWAMWTLLLPTLTF